MKFNFILFMFVLSSICLGQDNKFYLQEDATFLSASGKDYIVVEMPGKTKLELFTIVAKGVGRMWNSPKDVVSKVEGEQISVWGWIPKICGTPHGTFRLISNYFAAKVRLQWEFKDGKIKVKAPTIENVAYYRKDDDYLDIGISLKKWIKLTDSFSKGKPDLEDGDHNYERIMNAINNAVFGPIEIDEDW